ncbi:winged helix-turn-helix domain-containing protein [Sphingomonas sp. RS6]
MLTNWNRSASGAPLSMQDTVRTSLPNDGASPSFAQGRLVVRLISELQTAMVAAGIQALDGDLDRAIIFMVVARASEMRLPGSPGTPDDGRPPKAISINALAASLSRPFETMRRHIHALCGQGLCLRTAAGVIVPPEVHDRPAIAALFNAHHDAMVRFTEDLAGFGVTLPETRGHVVYDWAAGLAAAHDVLLTGIEFHAHRFQSWTDMILVNAIMCANARPFTHDPEIARLYADFDSVPPEALRKPVSTGAVARALGLPASTTHRRVAAMVDAGVLTRRSRGVMLAESTLSDPARIEDSRTGMVHTRQILIRLAAAGFRFDAPASCYLAGRPPLVQFE